jgi:hypothetical protein
MNDNEREMDLALAEAEQENRLLRARNERLERELAGQAALNKMADNARDLGLDYEPAPVQEIVAWWIVSKTTDEKFVSVRPNDWNDINWDKHPLYTTPPAAPVQGLPFGVGGGLVAIKTLLGRDPCVHANTAIEMIDAILKEHPAAQPDVQEGRDWSLLEATQESLREHMAEIKRLKAAQPVPVKTYSDGKPWPVAPKPWVNLTDEEMEDLWAIHSGLPLYRAIEAKLKEKNA